MARRTAAQRVAPQYAVPMAGRSPEGLPAALRLVDPTVVPPISEPSSAERTEGQPSLLVAFTGPTIALVPLRRGRSWGSCRCRCGFDLLSHTALLLSGTLL